METDDTDTNARPRPAEDIPAGHPLGFWLRLVDTKLTEAFDADGFDRRAWMVLNLLDGDLDDERMARLSKIARKRGGTLLLRLQESGWIEPDGNGWTLTDAGRAHRDALTARADAIRARVREAVAPGEYEALVASLEKIAREFGWDGTDRMPRGRRFGRRHGFGRHGFEPHGFEPHREGHHGAGPSTPFDGARGNAHRGFGPGEGPRHRFDPEHGFGPGHAFGAHGRPHRGFGPSHGYGPSHGFGPSQGHGPSHGFERQHRHEHGRGGFGPAAHDHGHGVDAGERCTHPHGGRGRHSHGRRKAERAYERGFQAGVAAASSLPASPED